MYTERAIHGDMFWPRNKASVIYADEGDGGCEVRGREERREREEREKGVNVDILMNTEGESRTRE